MRVAIIHEWLELPGGAEKVLKNILAIYPQADIFSLVDFFTEENRKKYLHGKRAKTSFIQKLPFARSMFRHYLPILPFAVEQFDLGAYDLILSTSHSFAKGVLTGPDQIHVCYQYSPIRYAWDMYHTYFQEHRINRIKRFILKPVLHYIRMWDVVSSSRVDYFIAISKLIQQRIWKYYRRDATIIFPPVDTVKFALEPSREDFYLTASRLVPYKKIKLVIQTFNHNGKPLVVAGAGEQLDELKKMASGNVRVTGYCDDDRFIKLMQKAKAFVYAAYEDFGIVAVEAMSCGTPVIAFSKGGLNETMVDGMTGVLFQEQSVSSINDAVSRFENMTFDAALISQHAEKFSEKRFRHELNAFIEGKYGMISGT